jgi:hypothetical protein
MEMFKSGQLTCQNFIKEKREFNLFSVKNIVGGYNKSSSYEINVFVISQMRSLVQK